MSDRNNENENNRVCHNHESLSIQEKVEEFFNYYFGKWGLLLAAHPGKIFSGSILFFILLSMGMAMRKTYENEQLIWTPKDNGSLKSSNKGTELFPAKGGFISFIAEVKDPSNEASSVITLNAVNEIKSFVDIMSTVKDTIKDKEVKWTDLCTKIGTTCIGEQGGILAFGYKPVGAPTGFGPPPMGWKLTDTYANDAALLAAVQSGKPSSMNGKVLDLQGVLGGTNPKKVTQNPQTGVNDIKSAKAAMMGFPFEFKGYNPRTDLQNIQKNVEDKAIEFSKTSKHVNIFFFTQYGLRQSFSSDLQSDLAFVQVSVMLVAVYCIIFMGGCSPIHFRSGAAGITLLCVGLSFGASNGFCALVGGRVAGIHNLLPFLLIGIGVDDMFVISSAIDQTDPRQPVEKRMMVGLQKAGSSITITSFTNAIAFFLGCSSSLEALSSFCFFAGMGILMLFLTAISVFSAFMVWDIKRQMNKKGDCCGACMCKEDTVICCKGRFLTVAQKSYPYQGEETDPVPNEKYSSGTQKFLHQKVSMWTTSKVGIIVICSIWLIYLAVSIWGASQVTIDFKSTYFIGGGSYVKNYLDLSENYFQVGERVTIYTDSKNIDMTSYDSQKKLVDFNTKVKACDGCSQQFTVSGTLNSWYDGFQTYSKSMTNVPGNVCQGSWDSTKSLIVPAKFMPCLNQYLKGRGAREAGNINMDAGKTKITSFKQNINLIYIKDAASDGVEVLSDMKKMCTESNLGDTFSFTQKYYDFETYVVFKEEAIMNVCLALVAVFVVLMIVTANFTVTMFVLLCVALVDVFLLGLLTFWEVTFNSVTVVNNVVAIGLAVDYSAHIGHAYLMTEPPEQDENGNKLSNHEKRVFKARGALGSMGSSVFHGAFSTLLAIIVLAPSKSYIFKNFFKMWFGIIIFGVSNGFILLPVLLSLCGPLNHVVKTGQVSNSGAQDPEAKKVQDNIEMQAQELENEGGNVSQSIEMVKQNQVRNVDTNRDLVN